MCYTAMRGKGLYLKPEIDVFLSLLQSETLEQKKEGRFAY